VGPGLKTDADLAEVIEALGLFAFGQASLNGRKEQGRQDENDADDKEELEEGEPAFVSRLQIDFRCSLKALSHRANVSRWC
jgi:hypothetical protein